MSRVSRGFTLVEIMIVVAIIGVLAVFGIPNFIKSVDNTRKSACLNNLRKISEAKDRWGFDNGKAEADVAVAADLDVYIKGGTATVYCLLDTTKTFGNSYNINAVNANPTCQKSGAHVLS